MFDFDKKAVTRIILLLLAAALLFSAALNIDKVFAFLAMIWKAFLPITTGLCLAFVMNIILRLFENKIFGKLTAKRGKIWSKVKRPLCLALTVLLVLGMIALLLTLVIPQITGPVVTFAEQLPQKAEVLEKQLKQWLTGANLPTDQLDKLEIDWVKISQTIIKFVTDNSFTVISSAAGVVSWITDLVLSFTFAIYLLASKEKIGSQARRLITAILPEKACSKIFSLSSMAFDAFENFVEGQFAEMLIIGTLCLFGMLILNIPLAPTVAFIVALTALIPIVGAFIGTALGALMILLIDPIKAIWFVIMIIVLQQVDNNFIYPRVVGSSVGLPGIWVLAAITVGGSFFGVLGMFVSVPIASVLYCLMRTAVNSTLKKREEGRKNTENARKKANEAAKQFMQAPDEASSEGKTDVKE